MHRYDLIRSQNFCDSAIQLDVNPCRPGDARVLMSVWRDAQLRRANAAACARSVAATLRIPVKTAVEFLTGAGVFVRAATAT
jgi:hypothetical protein